MAFYQLNYRQLIKADMNTVWEFIANPRNLKTITPEYMGFDITSEDTPDVMYEGMIISYKVSPFFNIKNDWVTEITRIRENEFFVDEQRIGPYVFWHHQHFFMQTAEGIDMRDKVTYSPPFGMLGAVSNKLFIRKKLEEIFSYRREAINKLFAED